jgi:hypothetical protein
MPKHLNRSNEPGRFDLRPDLNIMPQRLLRRDDPRSVNMTAESSSCDCESDLPGGEMTAARMPGHWLLARLGKRVLRPGGLELTHRMLAGLALTHSDDVVEFAPGLGVTARTALRAGPASYTAIERDDAAAKQVQFWLDRDPGTTCRRVITGLAQGTGLPDASASVVYGEAMLTMQTETRKRQIVREALRLLRPGGRYGIHELCLSPDDISTETMELVRRDITAAIQHQALPLTGSQWEQLLASEGFEVTYRTNAPMALLEPARLIRDEGLAGAARFAWRVLREREARQRVKGMRRVFRKHRDHMAAVCLVARKPL